MADPEIEVLRKVFAGRPRPPGLAERRLRLDGLAAAYRVPADVKVEATGALGFAAEWSRSNGADARKVILFLHGGGYCAGSVASHRPLAVEIGRAAGMATLAIEYRLAPEHRHPAAVDDALSAYRYLLEQGFKPRDIAIAGDSAGGGLTVATMVAAREIGLAVPACGWCISPWVDLECTGASMVDKSAVDPLIQKPFLMELAGAYLGGADARTPLASPIYADLRGLPPLLIQVGSAETLMDDSVRLARVAGCADVAVTLEIWPDMIHAWPLFHEHLGAGRGAIGAAARFIRSWTFAD